jgi:hypothetical protein
MRAALIREWGERLQADEAQVESAPPRSAWLFRARSRIYRLLLAMYGHGDWRADSEAVGTKEFQAVPITPGAPPKSAAEIRKTLKAVRSAAAECPAGAPLPVTERLSFLANSGLAIVFSSSEGLELAAAVNSLRASFISYSMQDGHLFVSEADRERALAVLASDRRERARGNRDRLDASNRASQRSLFVLLTLLFGSLLTFVLIPHLREARGWRPAEIVAACLVASTIWIALLAGWKAARRRWR